MFCSICSGWAGSSDGVEGALANGLKTVRAEQVRLDVVQVVY
jgi:hypothetical protein